MHNFYYQVSAFFKYLFLSRVSKDTTFILAGNGLSALFGIFITILLARFLGPVDWGLIAGVLSGAAIMSSLADLGFSSGILRFESKDYYQGKQSLAKVSLKTIFTARILTAFIAALLLLTSSSLITKYIFKTDNNIYVLISAVGLFFALLLDFQIATWESKQNFKLAAIFIALANFFRIIFIFGLIYLGQFNAVIALAIYFGSTVISFLCSLVIQPVTIGFTSQSAKFLRKLIPFTGVMGINRGLNALSSRVDVLLVLQVLSPLETGIYAAARHLSQGIPIILGSFSTVLAPNFASLEGQNLKTFFKKSFLISLIIGFIILAGILLAVPVISLFGSRYLPSISILQWLLIGMIPFALSAPAVNYIIYSLHKPQLITIFSLVQFVLIISGNILLLPKLGVLAPALILLIVNVLILFAAYFYILFFRQQ